MVHLELFCLWNAVLLAAASSFQPVRFPKNLSPWTKEEFLDLNLRWLVNPVNPNHSIGSRYLSKYHYSVKQLPRLVGARTGLYSILKLGDKLMGGTEAILKGIGTTAGIVRDWAKELAHIGVDFASNAALLSINVGKAVILPPLRGIEQTINLLHGVTKLGKALTQQVIDETKSTIKGGWKFVKSVDFPGKKTMVLLFPTGLISVVDYASHTTWYLWSLTGKTIKAAEAWTLFASLKVVSSTLGPAIRALNLECIQMREKKMNLNQPMIDTLEMGRSRICGWPNLVPVNNVTITSDENSFLVVNVPYVLGNLRTHFDRVNVTGLGETLIENVRMSVHIDKVHINSRIAFNAGTILRFMTIKLRVEAMDGFTTKFHDKKGNTHLENTIEEMGDIVGSVVAITVNEKFKKFENKISKIIKGS